MIGIQRRATLRRYAKIKKSKPRSRNRKRHAANTARAFGAPDRCEWMKSQPSIISGQTPCVSAHVRSGGTGRRADAKHTVPVTWAEHEEMHAGQKTFERKYGIDLLAEAAKTEARWQQHLARTQ
jgi:hypothetical protein